MRRSVVICIFQLEEKEKQNKKEYKRGVTGELILNTFLLALCCMEVFHVSQFEEMSQKRKEK